MKQEKLNRNTDKFMTGQDNFMKSFKANVEIYARENHLTLKQISELSDISFATINSFLYGNAKDCKLSTAVKLARAFGISVDELTGAGTLPETAKKSINIIRHFPRRTRYLFNWLVKYEQKLLSEDQRKKIINVFLSSNQTPNPFYNEKYTHIDISSCNKEIKSKVFMGLKINTEDYMPKYVPGDTLLIANDRTEMEYEDYVIVYYEKIYIVNKRKTDGKVRYKSIRDQNFDVDEKDIDMKMGYVAGVFYEDDE